MQQRLMFTVPYLIPPTVNHIYQPTMYTGRDGFAHRGRKLSKEAEAYYAAVAIFAQGRTVVPTDERERKRARYRVRFNVVYGRRQHGDIDNHSKAAIDGLVRAGVIDNDWKVIDFGGAPVRNERENPRTEYFIERLED